MWVRTPLKIAWGDLVYAAWRSILPSDPIALQQEIEAFWSDWGDALVCFSVRSGFDLLLSAKGFPEGDEIVFSALNVKGMIRIAERHRLVPVPVELDIADMAPQLNSLEAAITPKTRAIVVAHLFGTRYDLAPIAAIARRHGIMLIEDCAQVFDGRAYHGHEEADVRMFSFGPLKTATALGGAILTVSDASLLQKMREIQAGYTRQSDREFLKRVGKFALLKAAISKPVFTAVGKAATTAGKDYEEPLSEAVRNVAQLGSKKKLRKVPSAGMLALLLRRLTTWREGSLAHRRASGLQLQSMLAPHVQCPGNASLEHSYWVFPVLAPEPKVLIKALRAAGGTGGSPAT